LPTTRQGFCARAFPSTTMERRGVFISASVRVAFELARAKLVDNAAPRAAPEPKGADAWDEKTPPFYFGIVTKKAEPPQES